MKYIIGNWKSNKNSLGVKEWFNTFAKLYNQNKSKLDKLNDLEIVVCPPFIYLPQAARLVENYNLPIQLGAQDVSPFNDGPYTGEVSAKQLVQFVQYVIIGHSERRNNFAENDQMLSQKVSMAIQYKLQPIFCVQDETTTIPNNVTLVAYEPVWAIGSGQADTPENANEIVSKIKKKNNVESVIYGGSVIPDNITSFLKTSSIDGVLPGGASLDPTKFWQMILNAASI